MSTYLKFLRPGRMATHVDGFTWPEPGTWLEVEGDLVPCRNGLHVVTVAQFWSWTAEELWLVEVDDAAGVIDAGDKVVVRRARLMSRVDAWDERSARLLACDFAERVLPIFEREHPGDTRPRSAIDTARGFAVGEATASELAAARDAARAAARAAEHEWQTGRLREVLGLGGVA